MKSLGKTVYSNGSKSATDEHREGGARNRIVRELVSRSVPPIPKLLIDLGGWGEEALKLRHKIVLTFDVTANMTGSNLLFTTIFLNLKVRH